MLCNQCCLPTFTPCPSQLLDSRRLSRIRGFDDRLARALPLSGLNKGRETLTMISACAIPQLNEATFAREVLASPLPVFVHFVERDCHRCEIAQGCLADVMGKLPPRVMCFCVRGRASPRLAARYRIGKYPTILLFRDGRVARRLVGHPLPGELEIIFRTECP